MHRCSASITTATPRGCSTSLRVLRDLRGEPLLHLEPPAEHLDQPRDLRQPHDLAARHVGDVALAEERQEMVLAQASEVDVLHDHHLVVLLGEERVVQHLVHVLVVAGRQVPNAFATRSGVRSRPSRSGPRPAPSGSRRIRRSRCVRSLITAACASPQYSNRFFAVSTHAPRAAAGPAAAPGASQSPERAGQALARGDRRRRARARRSRGRSGRRGRAARACTAASTRRGPPTCRSPGSSAPGHGDLDVVVVAVRAVALAVERARCRRPTRRGIRQPVPGAEVIDARELDSRSCARDTPRRSVGSSHTPHPVQPSAPSLGAEQLPDARARGSRWSGSRPRNSGSALRSA